MITSTRRLALLTTWLVHLVVVTSQEGVSVSYEVLSDLDTTSSFGTVFGTNHSSFDVMDNWNFCMSSVTNVTFTGEEKNYTEMVNSALEKYSSSGGAVRLSGHTFPLDGPVMMPPRTCLVGVSMESTVLRVRNISTFPSYATGVVMATSVERPTIVALTIDGNPMEGEKGDKSLSGVHFSHTYYAWARNVNASNNGKHGFEMDGTLANRSIHGFFEACAADYNEGAGLSISHAAYGSVFNSMAMDNEEAGVQISGYSTSTLVKSNRLIGNGACGISMSEEDGSAPKEVVLLDNTVANSTHAAICANKTQVIVDNGTYISDTRGNQSFCYDLRDVSGFVAHNTVCGLNQFYAVSKPTPTASASSTISFSPTPTTTVSVSVTPSMTFTPSQSTTPTPSTSLSSTPSTSFSSTPSTSISNSPPPSVTSTPTTSMTNTATATPSSTISLSPSPSPSLPPAYLGCPAGKVTLDVCCPMSCEECKGDNCPVTDKKCCADGIKSNEETGRCSVNTPPCILDN